VEKDPEIMTRENQDPHTPSPASALCWGWLLECLLKDPARTLLSTMTVVVVLNTEEGQTRTTMREVDALMTQEVRLGVLRETMTVAMGQGETMMNAVPMAMRNMTPVKSMTPTPPAEGLTGATAGVEDVAAEGEGAMMMRALEKSTCPRNTKEEVLFSVVVAEAQAGTLMSTGLPCRTLRSTAIPTTPLLEAPESLTALDLEEDVLSCLPRLPRAACTTVLDPTWEAPDLAWTALGLDRAWTGLME
jgi:hypothetical protein